MAIAKKLGSQYESIRAAIRTKTLKLKLNDAEFDLKVRIPVKREMEEITEKIANPPKEKVEEMYQRLSAPIMKTLNESDKDFIDALNESDELNVKLIDGDVVVNGTSVRQIAHMNAVWHTQVEMYFSLLITPTGEPVTETFEEIAEEFPEEMIREIVKKIDEAIRPNYKDTKKN